MRKQRHTSVVHLQQRSHSGGKTTRDPAARRRLVIWMVVCTIFLIWASVQLFHQMGKISDKRVELEQVERQLMETEQLQHELKTHIEQLHDPDYVAELARKEYYMTKEGEIIFIHHR